MARIIYSGLVTEIKGSVGGTTFQSNAYGYTIKNKPRQKKPKTALQNKRKIYLALASQAWRSLTNSQRSDWNAWAAANPQYAKNNPSAVLSGFAVFVRHQFQVYLAAGGYSGVITSPSYTIYPVDNVVWHLYNDAGDITLQGDWDSGDGNHAVNIFISQPFSPTVNFAGSRTRFIQTADVDDSPYNITNSYIAIYGKVPEIGQKVFIDNVQYNYANGIVYARQSQEVIVESA